MALNLIGANLVGQGSSSQEVATEMSPPVAVINGGDRLYGIEQNLVLDASASWQPDLPPEYQSTSNLMFIWSCILIYQNGTQEMCDGFGRGTEPELQLLANSFKLSDLNITDHILINVNIVTNDTPPRSGQTSVKLYPTQVPTFDVVVSCSKSRYSANERIVLSSQVNLSTTISYAWSTIIGDIDISLPQNILSSSNRQKLLTVKPLALTPGSTYTFRLTATASNSVGWGHASVIMNIAPASGDFFVAPTSGLALETVFQISYHGWQDAELDLPIVYQVEYYEPTTYVLQGVKAPQVCQSYLVHYSEIHGFFF